MFIKLYLYSEFVESDTQENEEGKRIECFKFFIQII